MAIVINPPSPVVSLACDLDRDFLASDQTTKWRDGANPRRGFTEWVLPKLAASKFGVARKHLHNNLWIREELKYAPIKLFVSSSVSESQ
jgi:hypothetical protein